MEVDLSRSLPHAPFSLLRCEVLTHIKAKQSSSPSRRYISPKPDKHFRSPSPFEGERVRNSTKSSVADRTGAFTRGDAFTNNRDFTVEFNGIFSTAIPVRSSVENPQSGFRRRKPSKCFWMKYGFWPFSSNILCSLSKTKLLSKLLGEEVV